LGHDDVSDVNDDDTRTKRTRTPDVKNDAFACTRKDDITMMSASVVAVVVVVVVVLAIMKFLWSRFEGSRSDIDYSL
jgi:hypothetical protein